MTVGTVVVFNCFSEPMTMFSVNGKSAGAIAAWGSGQGGLLYAPAGLAVPRALNAAKGQFFNGTNKILFDWQGETFHFDLPIDGSRYPLNESLALFVLRSGFTLLDAFGVMITNGPLVSGPATTVKAKPSRE
jgi:hypothetical protein